MDHQSYTIRNLLSTDEPFLYAMLYQAIFVPEGREPPPFDVVYSPGLRKYVSSFGTQAGDMGCIAVDASEQPIGVAWLRLLTEAKKGYGYVDNITPELSMAVAEAWRGQGIGSALLDQLLDAAQKHFTAVSLSVWPDNPAYRLYQRCGFAFFAAEEDGPAHTMIKRFNKHGTVAEA